MDPQEQSAADAYWEANSKKWAQSGSKITKEEFMQSFVGEA
jgi:hypothetical protein